MLLKNEEGRVNFKAEDYSLVERISETDPSHANVRESIAGTKRDNHRETPTRKKIPSLKTTTDQPTVFNYSSSRSTSLISSCAANEAGDTVDEVSDFESEIDSPKLETDACKLSGGCSDFDVTNSKGSKIVEENIGKIDKSNKEVSQSKDIMYNRSNSFVCEIGCKKRAGKKCYSRVQGEITNVNSKKTKNATAGIVSGDDKRALLANNKHRTTTNCHKIRISGNMLRVSSSCLVKSLYLDLCVTASSCSDKPLKTENVNSASVTDSMDGQSMDLVKEQIEVRSGYERKYEDGAAKRICRGCSRRSRREDARCKGKRPHVMVDNGISGEESHSFRKNKNVGKLKPEFGMRKAKHNATRNDKMVVNERKPNKHQRKLKFDGNITSIPMTRTGENRHLIKQARRDAEEKRSAALKKSSDESHGKGFKDLSPPIRIIRGYAGESISDSDKDEIYSGLQLHDKETSLSGQSYHCGEFKSHKKGQHSTVEVDDSSVKVKDTPQCLVLVHTDKETIGHKTVKEDNTEKASGILENKFSNNVKDESELTGTVRLDVSVQNRDDTGYMLEKDCIGFHQTVKFNSATHETESSVRYKTCVHGHDAEDSSDSDNGTTHLNSKFIFPHLTLSYAKPSVDEMAQSPVSDVHDLVSVQSCVSERILPDYVKPLEYEFSKTGKEGSMVEDKMISTEVIPASNEDIEDQSSISRQNKANHLAETIRSEGKLEENIQHLFFANDDQNTDKFNSKAVIVDTRYVISEGDRYVMHYRALSEAPVLTNQHFFTSGASVSILRSQRPEEALLDGKSEIFSFSLNRPSGESCESKDHGGFQSSQRSFSAENIFGKDLETNFDSEEKPGQSLDQEDEDGQFSHHQMSDNFADSSITNCKEKGENKNPKDVQNSYELGRADVSDEENVSIHAVETNVSEGCGQVIEDYGCQIFKVNKSTTENSHLITAQEILKLSHWESLCSDKTESNVEERQRKTACKKETDEVIKNICHKPLEAEMDLISAEQNVIPELNSSGHISHMSPIDTENGEGNRSISAENKHTQSFCETKHMKSKHHISANMEQTAAGVGQFKSLKNEISQADNKEGDNLFSAREKLANMMVDTAQDSSGNRCQDWHRDPYSNPSERESLSGADEEEAATKLVSNLLFRLQSEAAF